MAAGPDGSGVPAKLNPREMLKQLSTGQFIALLIIAFATILLVAISIIQANVEEKEPLFARRIDAKTQVEITQELQSRKVDYEVSSTGKILVPKSRVRELRTEFEAMDITPDGQTGMSILDNTNPLKSGEHMLKLKSIQALQVDIQKMLEQNPNIMKAMVQIVPAKDSPFADESEPAKASVLLRLKNMAELSKNQVRGIQHSVANAIEGATPDDITITDQFANMLSQPSTGDETFGISQTNLDIQSKLEREREAKIQQLVATFLGPNKVKARVSLDINFDQVQTVEKKFGGPDAEGEPQKYSEQNKTETIQRNGGTGDVTGAAANVAQGVIPNAGQIAGSDINRQTLTNQYFIDELQTTTRVAPYEVERMSIALQLDYKEVETEKEKPGFFAKLTKTQADWIETELLPLSQEELDRVRDLVMGATGFKQGRDFISIQNFQFKPLISKKVQASMDTGQLLELVKLWTPRVLQILLFIAFIMLGFSLFRRFVAPILQQAQLEEPAISAALPSGPPKTVAELESELEAEIESSIPSAQLSKAEIMKKRLIEMVQQDPETVSGLVRTWLLEDE